MSKTLEYFIDNYYSEIANRIENQQIKHNLARIHSHRHISRCIIYSDWYCRAFEINDELQRLKLYLAIAFHDIGRQGELEDVWENQSYEIYVDYIYNVIKVDKKIVNSSKELVINKYENTTINDIIHDVDCLDIMRAGTGRGGIMGFDKKHLLLLQDKTFAQDVFITTAWQLINYTDSIDNDNVNCLKYIYEKNKSEWKIGI